MKTAFKGSALVAAVCGLTYMSGLSAESPSVRFKDVTKQSGIVTPDTWKYGGPAIADVNGDGRFDLILPQHHEQPTPLFWQRMIIHIPSPIQSSRSGTSTVLLRVIWMAMEISI